MTSNTLKRHKRIRLDVGLYAQPGAICSVTLAVRDRQPIFANPAVAKAAVEVLVERSDKTGVPVYGYCVMPDHIHIVLGPSADCDIMTFVGQYKNLVQRAAWGLGVNGGFWQTGFWDRFLRAEEQVEQVVEYVLNNPIRRGLVDIGAIILFQGRWFFHYGARAGDKPPRYRLVLLRQSNS
ncbi:MAG: transposase [Dehalococcoidia bacterium]|nr:transposase [Dehalococcoidia bacterium]